MKGSFYAACERIFRPDLNRAPIAVLSNNDGIIVALNAECKALGYKRDGVCDWGGNDKNLKQKSLGSFGDGFFVRAIRAF